MPKVRMLVNTLGSNNGLNVSNYIKGEEYDIGDELADSFLSMKVCELATEKKAVQIPENKAVKVEEDKKKKRGR
jgi:hypothetical protein